MMSPAAILLLLPTISNIRAAPTCIRQSNPNHCVLTWETNVNPSTNLPAYSRSLMYSAQCLPLGKSSTFWHKEKEKVELEKKLLVLNSAPLHLRGALAWKFRGGSLKGGDMELIVVLVRR
ncbi:hypothetical protein BJ875DRAFT_471970 [Amylocarpus encephaloides]|uniref:Uncharacterized protein n=1 Tax=Amylocarpus encephaloides TaxID=45428 RepID=A0A9P7YAX8_9HELO|nr:hypothetical protein BJ875DRAFT_471970 [Amylocarpus encephaloides]